MIFVSLQITKIYTDKIIGSQYMAPYFYAPWRGDWKVNDVPTSAIFLKVHQKVIFLCYISRTFPFTPIKNINANE